MLTIRPARLDDESFLINLTPRLADFPLPAWRTADEIAQGDRQILDDALHGKTVGAAILVAEEAPDGERAGYVFATTKSDYFTGERHAHVEVLAVDPGSEGRGIARALMAAIEQWARDGGLGFITLNVFDGNTRARALYTRLGYGPETVHYRKALGSDAVAPSSPAGLKLDGLAAELARCDPAEQSAGTWLSEFPGAITVCDREGIILEMNDRSVRTLEADGGRALVGTNLLDCHPEPSRGQVATLLAHPRVNSYTIERRGVRKLIYQAPWYRDGVPAGLVELSLEIPEVMPHFVREG